MQYKTDTVVFLFIFSFFFFAVAYIMSLDYLEKPLKVACCQLLNRLDKEENLRVASESIRRAASCGAKYIILPECFNSPYSVALFPVYAEKIPEGATTQALSVLAKELNVFITGGSYPEIVHTLDAAPRYYNTSVTFNTNGDIIAIHRKVHLFDMNIPNGIYFKESDCLSPGEKTTVFSLEGYGNVGKAICYDIRFPELAAVACRPPNNAFLMVYPSAFNMSTGPHHWHLLARARAVDNECYVIMCSPARSNDPDAYTAYGHSMIVEPFGEILSEANAEDETIIYGELSPTSLDVMKAAIPLEFHRKFEIYKDVSKEAVCSAL